MVTARKGPQMQMDQRDGGAGEAQAISSPASNRTIEVLAAVLIALLAALLGSV